MEGEGKTGEDPTEAVLTVTEPLINHLFPVNIHCLKSSCRTQVKKKKYWAKEYSGYQLIPHLSNITSITLGVEYFVNTLIIHQAKSTLYKLKYLDYGFTSLFHHATSKDAS